MEEEKQEEVTIPEDGDLSHVSAATRLRMQRVQELEAQRLQRILERSRSQQASAENVPAAGSRSPLLGRIRRAESMDSSNVGDGIPRDNKFLKRLHELVETAENEETRARYIRLIELEHQRMQHKPETNLGSRLSRSSSMTDRSSVRERYARRNSDQVNQARANRVSSPVSARRNLYAGATSDTAAAPLPHASSLSSILDSTSALSEKLFINKQEEGRKKLEELQKKRQEALSKRSSSTEDIRDTTGYRGAIFQQAPIPLETRSTFPLTRRMPETTGQYSSIQELREPAESLLKYGSDTSIDNIPTTRVSESQRFSVDAPSPVREEVSESTVTDYVPLYVNGSIQGTTFVNEEGHTQWLTPASPNYKQISQFQQFQQNLQKMKEAADRKKRSILYKEGLGDHSLAECFDPEYTFEERIAAIREKLYGSKVLIPSDKRQNNAGRGSPDGAAQAEGSVKPSSER